MVSKTKTSSLGGLTLHGESAKAFKEQFMVNPIKKNEIAQKRLAEISDTFKQFRENGFAFLKPKVKTKN